MRLRGKARMYIVNPPTYIRAGLDYLPPVRLYPHNTYTQAFLLLISRELGHPYREMSNDASHQGGQGVNLIVCPSYIHVWPYGAPPPWRPRLHCSSILQAGDRPVAWVMT